MLFKYIRFYLQIKNNKIYIILFIAEQLSLVNPNPSNELLSELFVPAIIPKYALLSGKYIHYFENILPTVTSIATPHPFTVEFHFFKKYILSSLNSIKGNNNFILEIIKYVGLHNFKNVIIFFYSAKVLWK